MFFKRTLLLSLVCVNFLSANVQPTITSPGKTALRGGVELVGAVYIGDLLYRSFIKDGKKMKRLEKILHRAGISLDNKTDYGLLSIFSLTTFRGYSSTLNAYHKEINDHQNLQQKKLFKLSLAPLVVLFGITGSSKLLKGIYGSL